MNITKVYYEELKSKCVNGKWESVRIGAEVTMDNNEIGYRASEAFAVAKEFVREKLGKEMGYDIKEDINKNLVKHIYEDVKALYRGI